ncbi:glycosyltransferase family 4 protein [Stratiformator vulcanicus]|uniref:GDP-mannose-dependent alpha-(1-6)-phosphatidylinositol monomannoside mannosyltransferase n=1 Tax=Stratiformator vulcanicus TaxID=2527980 RepID=A0A517QZH6_9PLAN|nr:glycosyltransferase family 4 protein [Stratiformator vulcanicus]QDT37008.1 GDP-mannose-dependent alpha-(1-6)-phosphatidylinositol monomannoside mannosyltransferase [Stratiformator vulcanicus]
MFSAIGTNVVAVIDTDPLSDQSAELIGDTPFFCIRNPIRDIESSDFYFPYLFKRIPYKLYSNWALNKQFEKVINEVKADTLFIHFMTRAIAFDEAICRLQRRTVIHAHGYDATFDLREGRPPFRQAHPASYLDRVQDICRRSEVIVASEAVHLRLTQAGVIPCKTYIKPYGIESRSLTKTIAEKHESDGPIRFLFLGRLIDCKGPLETISAFETACARGLDATLTIAGDGLLLDDCIAAAQSSVVSDRITILGSIEPSRVRQLMDEHHVFTLHSRLGPQTRQEEAFGVVFLEAMDAGCPVATGRSGGVPEIVVDGKTGLLFEPGDIDSHADALIALGTNNSLRVELGTAGKLRLDHHFSREKEDLALRNILLLKRPIDN